MRPTVFFDSKFFDESGLSADFGAESRLGIYIHVPFCPHICPYCDFVKTSKFSRNDVSSFFAALENQFDSLIQHVSPNTRVVTLYFGGGTPSLFPARFYRPLVEKIRARFKIEEFTVETNPFSNTHQAFSEWVELGVNRITLGAQSLNNEVLKYLGRKHSAEDVLRNIRAARDAGLEQIQVDLIFGVKQLQSQRDIEVEIQSLEKSGATGVSCYLLTIEESTPFASETNSTDESIVEEYEKLRQMCESLGFVQQETSNFSRFPPIHNRLYWYGLPYLGLGTGAHGLLPPLDDSPLGRRYRVGPATLQRSAGDDKLAFSEDSSALFSLDFSEGERTTEMVAQEMLLTLLRTKSGIPFRWLDLMYASDKLECLWKDQRIERAIETGALVRTDDHLSLSAQEKLRGDSWALLIAGLLHPE